MMHPAFGVSGLMVSGITFFLIGDQGNHGRTRLQRRGDFLGIGDVPPSLPKLPRTEWYPYSWCRLNFVFALVIHLSLQNFVTPR